MCYSAQIIAEYKRFLREFGALLSLEQFYDLYLRRSRGDKIKVSRAMDLAFRHPQSELESRIRNLIDEHDEGERQRLEEELFKQRRRLADAERALQVKTTKSAAESKRIAADKVEWLRGKLAALGRSSLTDDDCRIFPGYYAPVIVRERGQRVVRPMRYQCRLAGKPANHDLRFPGTYNARRDSLGGFWKDVFGFSHGVLVIDAFYEHVSRSPDGTLPPQNIVLKFEPTPPQVMLVACLWSKWTGPGQEELLSFAAITDEPPPEVSAAGHDRCVIPIKPEHLDAWLDPRGDLQAMQAILDDRPSPYYQHRLAA